MTASYECREDATLYLTREVININDFIIKLQDIYFLDILLIYFTENMQIEACYWAI